MPNVLASLRLSTPLRSAPLRSAFSGVLTLWAVAPLGACSVIVDGSLHDPMAMDACDGLSDGTQCTREGITAPLVCLSGLCTNSRCGDGQLDTRTKTDGTVEECDDGNDVPDDGCEPDCTITVRCVNDDECFAPDIPCQEPMCDGGECTFGSSPDNTPCSNGLDTGVCLDGLCVASTCGNSSIDIGEMCDDGNQDPGDGCSPFCKPECLDNNACQRDACLGYFRCEVTSGPSGQIGRCVTDDSQPVLSCDATCEVCDSPSASCVPSPAADMDFDGHASMACGGDDCDDTNGAIAPGFAEVCGNGVDENCNGPGDDGSITTWYADCDGDLYAEAGAEAASSCGAPMVPPESCSGGWTPRNPSTVADCLDTDPTISPGQRDYFASPYPTGLGSSFDYDCNGREDPEYVRVLNPALAACGTRCSAAPVIELGTTCGEGATLYDCVSSSGVCSRQASRVRYFLRCR